MSWRVLSIHTGKWLCFLPDCNWKMSSCSMIVMRSNAVERFKYFPDSGLSSLIESYWVVMVISSPTLFLPGQPHLLMIRLVQESQWYLYIHGSGVPCISRMVCFFPRRPCTFTVRFQTNCCFILCVKMKSCWKNRMKASCQAWIVNSL